jgi:hypothetical protein
MLTISKPLSAGQAQTSTRRSSRQKSKTIGHNRASSPGNGKDDRRDSSDLALSLTPCHPRRPPFCPFNRVALFFLAAALVKEKTSRHRKNGKNMKLEEVNLKTKEAVDFLVQSLESGQRAVLTQYLGAMAKFRNYSFLC